MRKSRFTEEHIIVALKEHAAATPRRVGQSQNVSGHVVGRRAIEGGRNGSRWKGRLRSAGGWWVDGVKTDASAGVPGAVARSSATCEPSPR